MPDLSVEFAGIPFKNPVVLASGTCGFGRELAEIFDLEMLGGICSKGLTLHPRSGNDGLRVWETPSGMLNSVGLENPGIRGYLQDEHPWLSGLDLVNIVNLSGHSVEDYCKGAALLEGVGLDIIELNISCPNVKEGGMNFGVKTAVAREVVRRVREVCHHKLVIKLSPNAEDIVDLARACEEEGADGVSLVNTLLGMTIDIDRRVPRFENTYAGLSGPAIKPVALRMVHQVAGAVSIPVMGIGGIATWQDAVEFILAGATLVQVGTATFTKPDIAIDILDGIAAYMDRQGIQNLAEIRGALK